VLHHQEGATEVDRHHPVPCGDVDLGAVRLPERREERGIVHEHVDLAEALDRPRDQALHRRLVADVEDGAHDGVGPVRAGDRLDDRGAVRDVRHDHPGAGLGKGQRVVAANPLRPAGHDGDAAGEPSHGLGPGPRDADRGAADEDAHGHDLLPPTG